MKYILIALVLLSACKQEAPKQDPATAKLLRMDSLKKAQKTVQEKTVVLYPFRADQNDWRVGAAFKNQIDTLMSDTANELTHISYYRVAVSYKLFDSANKPVFDKYGLQKDTIQWIDFSDKSIIHDFKKDWSEYLPKQGGKP